MQSVLTQAQELPVILVYLGAAFVVAMETALIIGLLVPGEATLLLVGFLAYSGTLRLVPALALMIVAAAFGDGLAFRSGRRHGPRLRASRWGVRVGEARWARADAMLYRLGGRGVFAARWVAFARTLVPRLAGGAGLPYRRFVFWNLAGVATWVGTSVAAGYLAGESYRTASHYLGKATGVVLVLLLAVAAIVLVGRWLGRNPDPARALLTRAAELPPLNWLTRRYGLLFFLVSMRVGPGWTVLLNLAAGLVLLFGMGLVLAWLIAALVAQSGLSLVDGLIADWMARRWTPGLVEVALGVTNVLRGPILIPVVTVVALLLGWRTRAWRADLVSVLGSAGAFVPLLLLAIVAQLTGPEGRAVAGVPGPVIFPAQNAVVTASLCTLAWLLARRTGWPVAVTLWTMAAIGIVTVCAARLYLNWSSASETLTSVLLGVLWTVVFMVAWATRYRAGRVVAVQRAEVDRNVAS